MMKPVTWIKTPPSPKPGMGSMVAVSCLTFSKGRFCAVMESVSIDRHYECVQHTGPEGAVVKATDRQPASGLRGFVAALPSACRR